MFVHHTPHTLMKYHRVRLMYRFDFASLRYLLGMCFWITRVTRLDSSKVLTRNDSSSNFWSKRPFVSISFCKKTFRQKLAFQPNFCKNRHIPFTFQSETSALLSSAQTERLFSDLTVKMKNISPLDMWTLTESWLRMIGLNVQIHDLCPSLVSASQWRRD